MILSLKKWCEEIIIAIVISIIIEMLIPENNNKKYIKVVIGIYIMFVSLSPILKLFSLEMNFENIIEYEVNESSLATEYTSKMKDIYVVGIKEEIKKNIEEMGYKVNDVEVYVDNNYEKIEKLKISIDGKFDENNVVEIEKIHIGDNENIMEKYSDIVSFLENNYMIESQNIIIN